MTATETFDQMTTDDRWAGWGYLGERARHLAGATSDQDRANREAQVRAADNYALDTATEAGLDTEALFTWANNKTGRWYADCMLGSNGNHAEKYLPGTELR